MLEVADRERTADLQQLDNPAFTSDDGEEPAEPDEPAEQQRSGAVFAVFSEVLAIGRMPKAAYQLNMVTLAANAITWCTTTPFLVAHISAGSPISGDTAPSALIWAGGLFFVLGNIFYPLVVGSLRLAVAPGAGLELLGINEMELSDESIKSLKTWRLLLFSNGTLPWVLFICGMGAYPFLLSPEEYRFVSNTIPTGEFGLLLFFCFTNPMCGVTIGLVLLHSWFLSMKIGAAITAPMKVQQVIDAVKRGRPAASTEYWHKNVTRSALDLHEPMGQLTTVWGPGVGFFTLANWAFAVGTAACFMLESKFGQSLDDMTGPRPAAGLHSLFLVLLVV